MEFADLVEVRLIDPEAFLVVRETLSRIGIASKKEPILYQSAHILHKQGKYAITHFKELFALDGKPTNMDSNDIARRNTIINLLAQWGLVEIVQPELTTSPTIPISQIKIVKFGDKANWTFVQKYQCGKPKNAAEEAHRS